MSLDELLGNPETEADEAEGLKPPRRLKSPENILQAMRWTSRQMLAGKIPGERGLATLRGLRLLIDAVAEIEPPEAGPGSVDVAELAKYRRRQAEGLKAWEASRNQARAELINQAREVLGKETGDWLEKALPIEGKRAPYDGPKPRNTGGLFLRGARPVEADDDDDRDEEQRVAHVEEEQRVAHEPASMADALLADSPGLDNRERW